MNIKLLTNTAKIPTRGSESAAGYDLYADLGFVKEIPIYPHTYQKIPTGIAMEIPEGWFGAIFPRSGLATKQGLRLANCVAVIDADYRGEWFIPLYNDSDYMQYIKPNDRIAQVVFLPFGLTDFEVVDELSDTTRGWGGFGSTGLD